MLLLTKHSAQASKLVVTVVAAPQETPSLLLACRLMGELPPRQDSWRPTAAPSAASMAPTRQTWPLSLASRTAWTREAPTAPLAQLPKALQNPLKAGAQLRNPSSDA